MDESNYKQEIRVRSTYVPRTQHSAISLLNGIYANANISIPLLIYPKPLETLLPPRHCPYYRSLVDDLHSSNEWNEFMQLVKPDRELFDRVTQDPEYLKADISKTYDQIIARQCTNQPQLCNRDVNGVVGECISNDTIASWEGYGDYQNKFYYHESPQAKEINKFGAGLFVSEMQQVFVKRACIVCPHMIEKPAVKMHVYSAHDMTVSLLLGVLLAKDQRWPSYASSVSPFFSS